MITSADIFIDFPEEFAMIEEINQYTQQILIAVEGLNFQGAIVRFEETNYPTISTSQKIVKFVCQSLPILSNSFISAMMIKNRLLM